MLVLFSPKYFKQIIIICNAEKANSILNTLANNGIHNIIAYISDEKLDYNFKYIHVSDVNLKDLTSNRIIDEIIISNTGFQQGDVKRLKKQLAPLYDQNIQIKSYEAFYEEIKECYPKDYLNDDFYNYFNVNEINNNKLYVFSKRFIEIVLSLTGVIIFLLLSPIIFIINIFANRGPLIYIQKRIGKNGKIFNMYKYRSMVVDAEKDGAVWATKNDKRVTLFGRFLRKSRLDELPQVFNILLGDMSFIGPRPERPSFVKELQDELHFYNVRHLVRPGLTGWAQVKFPYAASYDDQEKKLRYDLYYIKEQSAFLDFKILIKTINTVLLFKGQ